MQRGAWLVVVSVAAVAVAGCTGAGGATVSNNPGHFSYSGGGASGGTSNTYDWQNPATKATVSFSGGGAGSLSVTIKDSAGKQVFSETFSGAGGSSGAKTSSAGASGTWKIQISSSGAGGMTLNVDQA